MALLDAEPRSASVTAVEDTELLRLDQEPFYELMADRVELAHGIIPMLTRYVRARIRDATALNVRVRELEQAVHAQPHACTAPLSRPAIDERAVAGEPQAAWVVRQ